MILSEIATYLHDAGVIVYSPLNANLNQVFIDHIPAKPDFMVAFISTGGLLGDSKHGYDNPTFQIRNRAKFMLDAYMQSLNIYKALHGLDTIVLSEGTRIINCIGVQSEPTNIGYDNLGRQEYTINYQLEILRPSIHRV